MKKIIVIFTIAIIGGFFFLILPFKKVYAGNEQCLTAGFWIEDGFYNFFDPAKNKDSNNTFEQWADRQMDEWNNILSSSGVKDCFRIGKIVRVKDGALPLHKGYATNTPDMEDLENDVVWGFPTRDLTRSYDYWEDKLNSIDYNLLHELTHARYVLDGYIFNFNLDYDTIDVTNPTGQLVTQNYLRPIKEKFIYFSKYPDIMSDTSLHFYGPYSAGALNRVAGQHYANEYGNYNTPKNFAIYLNDIPKSNILKILGKEGRPLVNAGIKIYQTVANRDHSLYVKRIDNVSDINSFTNENGEVDIGNQPFGKTSEDVYKNMLRGIFLLEVSYNTQVYYTFLEISDFNLAYWNGATQEAIYDINTDIPDTRTVSVLQTVSVPSVSSLTVSNYNDFRFQNESSDEGSQTITLNGAESQNIPWILSTRSFSNPLYIRKVYSDQTVEESAVNALKHGDVVNLLDENGININLQAKEIKRVVSVLIDNREVNLGDLSSGYKFRLSDQQTNNLPIMVTYSNGETKSTVLHIVYQPQNFEVTFTPTPVVEPTGSYESPTTLPPVSCSEPYPQCGGTVGLESYPSKNTILVMPICDENGNIIEYRHSDLGDRGECSNQN